MCSSPWRGCVWCPEGLISCINYLEFSCKRDCLFSIYGFTPPFLGQVYLNTAAKIMYFIPLGLWMCIFYFEMEILLYFLAQNISVCHWASLWWILHISVDSLIGVLFCFERILSGTRRWFRVIGYIPAPVIESTISLRRSGSAFFFFFFL